MEGLTSLSEVAAEVERARQNLASSLMPADAQIAQAASMDRPAADASAATLALRGGSRGAFTGVYERLAPGIGADPSTR
jgi:hypothetical protein